MNIKADDVFSDVRPDDRLKWSSIQKCGQAFDFTDVIGNGLGLLALDR